MKPRYKLEEWYKDGPVIWGKVFGHPNFIDGQEVHTSRIVKWLDDGKAIETLNSIYDLGMEKKAN